MVRESQQIIGRRVVGWGLLFLGVTLVNALAGPWAAHALGLRLFLVYPIIGILGLALTIGGAVQWVTGRGGFGARQRSRTYVAAWFVAVCLALFLCSLGAGFMAPS